MDRISKLSVPDAVSMAVELHKTGEIIEARNLYRKVLDVVPDHPDALHYLGVALHQLGDSEAAIKQLERSLEMAPGNAAALNNLGNIYRECGRLEEAESAYCRVLEIAPRHADTLVNLGIIYRAQKQLDRALESLGAAIEIDPGHPAAYHNLGNVFRNLERFDDALHAYRKSAELSPDDDKTTLSIARVLYVAGKHDEAIEVLERMLKQKPGHVVATHVLAAYSGENVPARASNHYVKELFDSFASSFDESLARLEYKAPQLIGDRVNGLLSGNGRSYDILDIGCGTGLCGPLLRPIAETLTGIDLSPKMLDKARRRKVYDRLEEAELTEFMYSAPNGFDVVVCVDTLVYFGDLAGAIDAAHRALRDGGWLFFTVEQHDGDDGDFLLQYHGRYSHARSYLEKTLEGAGFRVEALDQVQLRNENQKPVEGVLAVARKP